MTVIMILMTRTASYRSDNTNSALNSADREEFEVKETKMRWFMVNGDI